MTEFRSQELLDRQSSIKAEADRIEKRRLKLDMTNEEYCKKWEVTPDRWNTNLRPYSTPARIKKRVEMLKSCWKRGKLPESRFHDWEILVENKTSKGLCYEWQSIPLELLTDCILELNSLKLSEEDRVSFMTWAQDNIMIYKESV